jgi:hypothetical protein
MNTAIDLARKQSIGRCGHGTAEIKTKSSEQTARANCSLLSIFVMHIGIDGLPLLTPLTGVGHYTLDLARVLSSLAPTDEFQLPAPGDLSRAVAEKLNKGLATNFHWVQSQRCLTDTVGARACRST